MELILVGLLVCVLISWMIAQEFQEIALMKGYDDKKYFWFSFFFGIVGYLMIMALPMKEFKEKSIPNVAFVDDEKTNYVGSFPVQELSEDAGIKQCPNCGVCHDSQSKVCPSCQHRYDA